MADIDKVYKGLYCCRNNYPKDCKHCPYEPNCTHHETCDLLIRNALSIVGEYWANKPQIVRCKDCKKRNSWECWQYFFGRIKIPDDWFCADGEKKE